MLTTSGHDNKAYDITGPEYVGVRELADAVMAVTGKMIAITPPAAPGGASLADTAVPRLTGRPATTVKMFLAANKARLISEANQSAGLSTLRQQADRTAV